MKKKKKKSKLPIIILTIITLLVGALLGFFLGSRMGDDASSVKLMCELFAIFIASYIQVMIHEAGHLVFGLMSGYNFLSFRIGNFMWVREDGKLQVKHLKVVGTAGQCLMGPPDLVNGKMPYVLYNLGGSFANVISSVVCFALLVPCRNIEWLSTMLLILAYLGIFYAIINAVPLNVGDVSNDGYNVLSFGKKKESLYSLWVQLKISQQLAKGKRLKDIPDDWLYMPTDKGDVMISAIGALYANRLLDLQDFEKTSATVEEILEQDYKIINLYKHLLTCDQIYCYLIANKPIDELYDKELKQFMKQMKKYPSVLRTKYAIELCHNHDESQAEKVLQDLDKIASKYPYSGEIESEYELIGIVKSKLRIDGST